MEHYFVTVFLTVILAISAKSTLALPVPPRSTSTEKASEISTDSSPLATLEKSILTKNETSAEMALVSDGVFLKQILLGAFFPEGLKDLKDKPTVSGNVENLNHLMDFDIEKPSPRPRKDSNVMEGIRDELREIRIILANKEARVQYKEHMVEMERLDDDNSLSVSDFFFFFLLGMAIVLLCKALHRGCAVKREPQQTKETQWTTLDNASVISMPPSYSEEMVYTTNNEASANGRA